jgi:hypothetical protein
LLKRSNDTSIGDYFNIRLIVADLIIAVEEILEVLGGTLNLEAC